MSENIAKEFKFDVKKRKGSFEEVMEQLDETQLNFVQSPFFAFKDSLLEEFLENYAQMVSFNFNLPGKLKIENDLFFGSHATNQNEKIKQNLKNQKQNDNAIEIESEGEKGNKTFIPLLDNNVPLIPQQNRLFDITNASNNQMTLLNSEAQRVQAVNLNTPAGSIRDPFQEFQMSETTVCLLGQNDKALYLNEHGNCELVTLEIEVLPPEEKKGPVLKNFAACTFFDRNKVIYTGGGPSKDVYLLEFKSKKNVVATSLSKMLRKRCWHGALYIRPYLYVVGNLLTEVRN